MFIPYNYLFLLNWSFYHYKMSLMSRSNFFLKSILPPFSIISQPLFLICIHYISMPIFLLLTYLCLWIYSITYRLYIITSFFKNPHLRTFFSLFFRGRGKKRKKTINTREKHWLVTSYTCLDQGLNLQPRHTPWLGIELATLQCIDNTPTNWATLARCTVF